MLPLMNMPARQINGEIPARLKIKKGARFLFISRDHGALTHGLHKYPAKFFPELPRFFIARYSKKGDTILDPFMGSGTTNIEALIAGRHSVGVDIDPFSRFLAQVKTTPLNKKSLLDAKAQLECRLQNPPRVNSLPSFPYRDQWFCADILQELASLKAAINSVSCSVPVRNFLLVCFSSIIRECSQADNHCTRTVIRKKLNKKVFAGYPTSLFLKRLNRNTHKMLAFADTVGKPTAIKIPKQASATNLQMFAKKTFHLAVTSPPYMNAVDYPRTHQLEMYWLGFANGSLQKLKRHHVGTEAVRACDYATLHKTGITSADTVIRSLFATDPRRAFIAYKFIHDMVQNLEEVYRVLKKNGHYAMVIGNNRVRGHEFESWRYLKQAARKIGYTVKIHFVSGIINHFIKVPRAQRIQEDHILVLQKT